MAAITMKRNHYLVFILWGIAATLWLAVHCAYAMGWRINHSPSLPVGLWRLNPVNGPIQRGHIVSICPPDNAVFQEAQRRGYLGPGACPGGYEPLLKPVAAIPGDRVVIDGRGIAVNGQPLANSIALAKDRAGRPLPRLEHRTYTVAAGELWLTSEFHPQSFDSRYFGPLASSQVQGITGRQWRAKP